MKSFQNSPPRTAAILSWLNWTNRISSRSRIRGRAARFIYLVYRATATRRCIFRGTRVLLVESLTIATKTLLPLFLRGTKRERQSLEQLTSVSSSLLGCQRASEVPETGGGWRVQIFYEGRASTWKNRGLLHLLTRHLIGESRKRLDFSTRTASHVFSSPRLIAFLPLFFTRISDYSMFDNKSFRYLFRERNRFLFTCSSFETCQSLIFILALFLLLAPLICFFQVIFVFSLLLFPFSSFLSYLEEQTTLVSLCTCTPRDQFLCQIPPPSWFVRKRPPTLRLIGLAIYIL